MSEQKLDLILQELQGIKFEQREMKKQLEKLPAMEKQLEAIPAMKKQLEKLPAMEKQLEELPAMKTAIFEINDIVKNLEKSQEKQDHIIDLLSSRSIDQESEIKRIKTHLFYEVTKEEV